MISKSISNDIPPQMNILNMVIPILMYQYRAFDYPILGPKYGPIPNAKNLVFAQFETKKFPI